MPVAAPPKPDRETIRATWLLTLPRADVGHAQASASTTQGWRRSCFKVRIKHEAPERAARRGPAGVTY